MTNLKQLSKILEKDFDWESIPIEPISYSVPAEVYNVERELKGMRFMAIYADSKDFEWLNILV